MLAHVFVERFKQLGVKDYEGFAAIIIPDF